MYFVAIAINTHVAFLVGNWRLCHLVRELQTFRRCCADGPALQKVSQQRKGRTEPLIVSMLMPWPELEGYKATFLRAFVPPIVEI